MKLEKSVREYVKAWVLLPVLHRLLGWENKGKTDTIFNLSVGYNLEGILEPRMQKFIDTMLDASDEIAEYREELRKNFPDFADVEVPNALTNSCTLSTMHGCPPKRPKCTRKSSTRMGVPRKNHTYKEARRRSQRGP